MLVAAREDNYGGAGDMLRGKGGSGIQMSAVAHWCAVEIRDTKQSNIFVLGRHLGVLCAPIRRTESPRMHDKSGTPVAYITLPTGNGD